MVRRVGRGPGAPDQRVVYQCRGGRLVHTQTRAGGEAGETLPEKPTQTHNRAVQACMRGRMTQPESGNLTPKRVGGGKPSP